MTQHRDDRLAEILNQCCELLWAGMSVTACLERYPEHASDLAPLLTALTEVRMLRAVPPRAPEILQRSRAQFQAAAYQTSVAVTSRSAIPGLAVAAWWHNAWSGFLDLFRWRGVSGAMPVGLLAVLIAIIFLGVLTTGAVTASSKALPGDPLYPVKAAASRARILLARDPDVRAILAQQLADEQLRDAMAVVGLQRRVNHMPIAGRIEALGPGEWNVSGLRVIITPDTRIEGTPRVGARVAGTVSAPGDGTLVGLVLTVEFTSESASGEPRLATVPATATRSPTPTATAIPPSATPSPTPTLVVESDPTEEEVLRAAKSTPRWQNTATKTPRPAPTRTRTVVPVPTVTVAPMPTTTWTPWTEGAKSDPKARIIGWVIRIENNRWTIDEYTVEVDGDTDYIGDPGVGSKVDAYCLVRSDGSFLALEIVEIGEPESTPEPYEFTGVVQTVEPGKWTIQGQEVRIDADTIFEGNPQIGDWVKVVAEVRAGGAIWAKLIRKLALRPYEFEGTIESIVGNTWRLNGTTFQVDAQTQITGEPVVGQYAQVHAEEWPDGTLVATLIYILPNTPAALPSATPTLSAAPIDTPSLAPTATNTVEPSPTPTPSETPTPTETPSATATPTAVPTETPTPTLSPTPEPLATQIPALLDTPLP